MRTGTLRTDADGALGKTSELNIYGNAATDLNGTAQAVDVLTGQTDSALNLNGGILTLRDGGLSQGSLRGSGNLNVAGGVLDVRGANAGLSAQTSVISGAEVILNDAQSLGSGSIVDNGTVTLKSVLGNLVNTLSGEGVVHATSQTDVALAGNNSDFGGQFTIDNGSNLTVSHSENLGSASVKNSGLLTVTTGNNWTMNNAISGTGGLTKKGTGKLTLTQTSAEYMGTTEIEGGEIALGSSATPVNLSSTSVNIHDSAILSASGSTSGDVNVQQGGTLQAGNFLVKGNLVNSGQVLLNNTGGEPGNQLVVNGNYKGNNGLMVFNGTLGADNSPIDKLTVHGNTAGNTLVSVNNIGGAGDYTINGIQLIQVDGDSAGNFAQAGRIIAGAYDYSLVRGTGTNSANWYLTNERKVNPIGPDPVTPPGPDPVTHPDPDPVIRPETASYVSNLAAANTLFMTGLHDRLGETQYTDLLTGEHSVTSMWMRNEGGHNRSRDSRGQIATQANRYVLQLGGDIAQWSRDGLDRWHLGAMAGYANQQSNSRSSINGYNSDGSISGYSVGLYGTWYSNDTDKTGLYIDTWALYNWFNNSVKGEGLPEENYKSRGITASLESGYTFNVGEFSGSQGSQYSVFIQPKAQVVWMGVEMDDHREANGTRVTGDSSGNVMTRLGLRTYINGHSKLDEGRDRTFQPFVEANWIHNTRNFSTNFNGVSLSQSGARNIGEMKTGVEGQLNKNLTLWGNVAQQFGDKGYSDTSAMLGVKMSF